jgi:UDP-glucose:tetrahydrobiopterin glucosyltransferase
MRIALVAPLVSTIAQPFLGGAQAMLAALAQGLARRGHHVTLFAREGSDVPDVQLETIAVPHSVRPTDFSTPVQESSADSGFFAQATLFLDLFLQLRQRQQEFDIVHAHAFDWPSFVCSAYLTEIPVLHTLHLPAIVPEINDALHILHRRGHPLPLITVSRACARTYSDYTLIDYVIYNGLNLDAIPFSPQVPSNAPLLFAGRIAPEKGVEAAIEIAERATQPLLIAGNIYNQQYYKQRIAPRVQQSNGRVRYLGHLDHAALWTTMSQARGLLFPIAWDEPFGLVPVEAMATGTPVIAFRRGATDEIIKDGETGFLVAPDDCARAAALVDALPTLSRTACRAHVERHFSLARMLDEHERVYHEVQRRNYDT